jgi:NAD(P)-dependent dehydrogenase (short-subunit alcohol dehydrogenase family)
MKDREEVAVVTEAARGIRHRVSFVLAGERFRIAANELHEPEETLEALRATGREALSVPGDVSDEAAVRGMIEKVIDGFGRVD